MMDPVVIIHGNVSDVSDEVINGLVSCDAATSSFGPEITGYQWLIDNKYYTASVWVCRVSSAHCPPSLLQRCEALVIVFDPDQETGLALADAARDLYTDHCQPDVCLLVCRSFCHNTAITKQQAEQWCVDRGFELVQLTQPPDDDSDYSDQLIADTYGSQRIAHALQTHTWSNLTLKELGSSKRSKNKESKTNENRPVGEEESHIADSNTKEGECSADFEVLFSRLSQMRSESSQLPIPQRRLVAERIATEFWRAMALDGDDSEESEEDNSGSEFLGR